MRISKSGVSNAMKISVSLNGNLAKRLNRTVIDSGESRDELIRRALEEWLPRGHPKRRPKSVMTFKGVRGAPRFESSRSELF